MATRPDVQQRNIERGEEKRRAYERSPKHCPCGMPIPYLERKHTFCSLECAQRFPKVRQRDPSKWIEFACEFCGKLVERRTSVPGPRRFCSNACAHHVTHRRQHIVIADDDVVLDSGWEALFFGLCKFNKIAVERFDRSQCIEWDGHVYGPDFIVHWRGRDIAVEIKGIEDSDDQLRWGLWREHDGRPLLVVDRSVMNKLLIDFRSTISEVQ